MVRDLSQAMGRYARNLRSGYNPFGGGGFGASPPPLVEPGTYVVSIAAGGQTFRQNLRVERATGFGAESRPPGSAP